LSSAPISSFIGRHFNLGVLFTAAVLGIVYIFLVPPWQHNDEPTKFEFAWLLANRQTHPQVGDYDQAMRREVAASMIEHGFFRDLTFRPNFISLHEPVWIGISQINGEPLYYYLASLPLRLFRYTDITFQLYSARFISFLLYLLTVWVVLLASKELFSETHPLSKIVPLFVAFLPGFVDLMTAVNDDVGAVAFLTLFFWASIRVLKGGLNFQNGAILLVSILLCVFTKRTAWLAVPFGILVIYLGVFKNYNKSAILSAAVLSVIGLMFVFSWRNSSPAFFYSPNNHSLPMRTSSPQAQAGNYIITMNSGAHSFHQPLGSNASQTLAGETVTLGLWAWASEPIDIYFPQLRSNGSDILQGERIRLNTEPTFYSHVGRIPEASRWLVLSVFPGVQSRARIHFDCLVLVRGEHFLENILSPEDIECSRIAIGEVVHNNFLRNASGEKAWPVVNDTLAPFLDSRFSFSISSLWGIFDPQATWHYFSDTSAHLFRTFWGKFGWGDVSLLGQKPYRIFLFLTFISLLGWILIFKKDRPKISYSLIFLLGLAAFFQIGLALFRAGGNWYNYVYTPNARYAYPSIFPIAVLLMTGWWNLIYNYFEKYQAWMIFLVFSLLVILNIWSVLSIISFFY
jgi:hypothetical protein